MIVQESYLLLGEGDFTFALDMCRYIAASLSIDQENAAPATATPPHTSAASPRSVSITCTGIDTLEELHDKYKDIDFILRNIRSCCSKQQAVDDAILVDTTILHGINAVQAECDNSNKDDSNNIIRTSYDHVLFNHPHLGTENSQLHSRFLQHFFHASSKRWMKAETGLLYLTLVNGQCSRWKCIEGARKHGLVLLRRGEFVAPPSPPISSDGGKTYYSLRRHQSGRSFANRRRMQGGESRQHDAQNESETLVFGRACDYPTTVATKIIGQLPWETANNCAVDATTDTQNNVNETVTAATPTSKMSSDDGGNTYPCRHCSKSFQEQRSLKNHMICLHPDCEEVRTWKSEKSTKKKNKKRKLKNVDGHDGNIAGMQQSNAGTPSDSNN
ncbi:hypothetical protein ACHAXR_001495, partial [Thalassiosira sp. AJA248-18]